VLWFTTMLGLTFGAGYIGLGLVAFAVALLTVFVLPAVEGWVKNDWYATVTITSQIDGPSEVDLRRMLKDMGVRVKNVDLEYNLDERKKIVQYELKFKKTNLIEISRNVVHSLLQQPGITHVKWA